MHQPARTQWVGVAVLSAFILLFGLLYVSFHADFATSVASFLPSTFRVADDCIIPPFPANEASSCYHKHPNTLLLGQGHDPHITTVLTHIHGFTVFENIYLRNGTFFVVHPESASLNTSAQAEGYPLRQNIITKIVDYGPGVDFYPNDQVRTLVPSYLLMILWLIKELTFVTASNASNVLGDFVRRVNGVTIVMYDPVNFMHVR